MQIDAFGAKHSVKFLTFAISLCINIFELRLCLIVALDVRLSTVDLHDPNDFTKTVLLNMIN